MVTFSVNRLAAIAIGSDEFARFRRLRSRDAIAVAGANTNVIINGHRFVTW